MTENCNTCKFSKAVKRSSGYDDEDEYMDLECHRYPPDDNADSRRPIVSPTEWCGEFKPT